MKSLIIRSTLQKAKVIIQGKQKTIQNYELEWKIQHESYLSQILSTPDKNEQEKILNELNNKFDKKAVCAKQLAHGDVAWRCFDCEKDSTCIICQSCFEKGDHNGHKIQLKRNVGGCCDCGDPEALDQLHFCSDHQGANNIDPQQIISEMPESIKNQSEQVFKKLAQDLKFICLELQNYNFSSQKVGMKDESFKKAMIAGVNMNLSFFSEMIQQVPAFIHIIDDSLTSVVFDETRFQKINNHLECCKKFFPPGDNTQMKEYEDMFLMNENQDKFCVCNPLDLLMQTNHLLNNSTRKVVYDFIFKMFQSYKFKQRLTLSFANNYETLVFGSDDNHENQILQISVQCLTSDEMSMLIFREPDLRNNILSVLHELVSQLRIQHESESAFYKILMVLSDIKYMARPESMKYCVANTNFIQKMIISIQNFYFCHFFQIRNEMVTMMQEGQVNGKLIHLEKNIIKMLILYLKEVPTNLINESQWLINSRIIREFFDCFKQIDAQLKVKGLNEFKGFYNLPLHRIFAYYLTRLMLSQSILKQDYQPTNFFEFDMKDLVKKIYFYEENLNIQSQNQFSVSSLIDQGEDEEDKQQRQNLYINELLEQVALTIIKSISFIHEILSRKWVYSGIYLEYFPKIYYSMPEQFVYQDICLFQMLMILDKDKIKNQFSITDFIIDNFGLDQQLQILFQGLQQQQISEENFKNDNFNIQFAPEKLRIQLNLFLRFLIQLNITEISFIKQVYNRREQKVETQHHIQNENSDLAKNLWQQVLKKEAVHALLLNKINVNIETLKESVFEPQVKDKEFVDQLFQVSNQARDYKNQITFQLLPSYFKWFDPFHYVQPEQFSLIFQMFQSNQQIKEQPLEEGVNDFVGDYLQNYQASTPISDCIAKSLTRSKIIDIILPLIKIWLQFMNDENVQNDSNDQEEFKNFTNSFQGIMRQIRLQSQTSSGNPLLELLPKFKQNFIQKTQKQNNNDGVKYDQKFLAQIVDSSIGHHCLKLLVIILNSKRDQSETENILQAFLSHKDLINYLILYKNQTKQVISNENFLIQQDAQRLNFFLSFLFNKIYQLSPSNFPELSDQFECQISDQSVKKDENILKKKDEMKKRQSKLLQKMKNKGKQYLESVKSAQFNQAEIKQEENRCSFCQEELITSQFLQSPFCNFGYIQTTKLYTHSVQQTIEQTKKCFQNQNTNLKVEEEKTQSNETEYKLEKDKFASLITDDGQINLVNEYTGGGSILTHCPHFCHISCLASYTLQNQSSHANLVQRQICGLSKDEFQCPICKQISNTFVPSVALKDISSPSINILTIYMKQISDIALKQQGFLSNEQLDLGLDNEMIFKLKTREILLGDLKENPQRTVNFVLDSLIHRIALTSLKGLPQYFSSNSHVLAQSIRNNLKYLIEIVYYSQDKVLANITSDLTLNDFYLQEFIKLRNTLLNGKNLFDKPLEMYICKIILFASISGSDLLIYFLQLFTPLLKIQALIAVYFRKKQIGIDTKKFDSLDQFEQYLLCDRNSCEMHIDAQLPLIRKLFITLAIIQEPQKIRNQIDLIINATSNQEELVSLYKALELDDSVIENNHTQNSFDLRVKSLFVDFSNFVEKQFFGYIEKQENNQMPDSLMLLNPCFQFQLKVIPSNFMNLQKQFYKKDCEYCKKQVLDTATCLLCGKIMCWYKVRSREKNFEQCKVGEQGQQNKYEGLLSWHARVCESGQSIFLQTSTGSLILINNGSATLYDSPYRNKFGEIVSEQQKNMEEFSIDQEGGGLDALNHLKRSFLEFKIPNLIVSQRMNPDTKYKIVIRNIY